MNKIILVLGVIVLLPSCFSQQQQSESSHQDASIIDLGESTRILRELIQTHNIGDLLEDHDEEQLEALLNNTSPVEMAAEVEIIRTPIPVVAYFFEPGLRHDHMMRILKDVAHTYNEKVKFVMIDGPKLFQLYDMFAINTLPTVLFFKNGEIITRLEDDMSKTLLERGVTTLLARS